MKVELDLKYSETMAGSMGIVARLRKVAETGEAHGLACTRDIIADFADQIEAQLPKPKPEEPTGLGAVVEDAEGNTYTRVDKGTLPWFTTHKGGNGGRCDWTRWDRIDAVRVLSEGVTT